MKTTILLDNLCFAEGPRWHEGKLWFSDMYAKKVMTVDLNGKVEMIVEVENHPSGLGWLPNGDLLIVSMIDRRLLKYNSSSLVEVANLYDRTGFYCNDMVVDKEGNAYIGNFGFDLHGGEELKMANIIKVTPSGNIDVVAEDMMFPNGSIIMPDEKTMIIAETFASQLTAFDINEDKTLSNRRIWAKLENYYPDGICLDPNGEVWVATPMAGNIIRVREGGEITKEINLSQDSFACAIGGENKDLLFICTAPSSIPNEAMTQKNGRIEIANLQT